MRLTLISDSPTAFYSGMFPGCVAGLYRPEEIQTELGPLCHWAGARFIRARMAGLDLQSKQVLCEGRPPVPFEVLSLNVGSVTRGMEVPGVREHAIPTRPISRMLERVEAFDKEHQPGEGPTRIIVAGGGAAGVELCFAMHARIVGRGGDPEVTLVDANPGLLADRGPRAAGATRRMLLEKGVSVISGARVERVREDRATISSGQELPFDLLLWATGAAAPPVLRDTGLETDDQGFVRVSRTLRTVSSADVFAAGDCISFEGRDLPKAGVYAVREGPVLADNLLRRLSGEALEDHRPQDGFLALLMTGDGEAILSWKGLAVAGKWVWKLKDRIDRKWMRRYEPRMLGRRPERGDVP